MEFRKGIMEDLPAVAKLQSLYHIATISQRDRDDGFVTTLFSNTQFEDLIVKEDGLAVAIHGDEVVAYAMAASWQYWCNWPLFQHMIADLPRNSFHGHRLSCENTYQYGPICIHRDYRGSQVLPNLFEFSRRQMVSRFPILITFINRINSRSLRAHTKLGLEIIKDFVFNDSQYYELGYCTNKPTANHTL